MSREDDRDGRCVRESREAVASDLQGAARRRLSRDPGQPARDLRARSCRRSRRSPRSTSRSTSSTYFAAPRTRRRSPTRPPRSARRRCGCRLGISNDETAARARATGPDVVMDKCIGVAHRTLIGHDEALARFLELARRLAREIRRGPWAVLPRVCSRRASTTLRTGADSVPRAAVTRRGARSLRTRHHRCRRGCSIRTRRDDRSETRFARRQGRRSSIETMAHRIRAKLEPSRSAFSRARLEPKCRCRLSLGDCHAQRQRRLRPRCTRARGGRAARQYLCEVVACRSVSPR